MACTYLSLFGGFEFIDEGGKTLALGGKSRALLAYLALQPGHSQSREKLAALLWGGSTDSQARMSLRQALTAIRKSLPPATKGLLLAEGDRIVLDLIKVDCDVPRFEKLISSAAPDDLEQAMNIYRGGLLDGFDLREEAFEDWLRVERERLRGIAIMALDRLAGHYFAENKFDLCAHAAMRLLSFEPLREDIHRTLMRVYAAQGRSNLALRQYQRCRDTLQHQLGLQPMPETRALYDDIRARRGRMNASEQPSLTGGMPPSIGSPLSQADRADRFRMGTEPIRPTTRYVKSDGVSIAYQVTGVGPVDLVYVQGWVSNLDFAWESPRLTHVLKRLESFCRLIRIDKRGTGLSDRNVGLATLEARTEDVRAVLDAVGSRRTFLFGSSEGGTMCMLFAASYPERTAGLILHGAYAKALWSSDYPWGRTREEVEEDLAIVERDWGEPADLSRGAPSLMRDTFEREWFAAYLRNSASPADAISQWRWSTEIDARDILHAIHVPTLIIHRTGDQWVKVEEGRFLAKQISGATYVELPGDDHLIWGADSDRLVDAIQNFVLDTQAVARGDRVLLTILRIIAVRDAATGARPAPSSISMQKLSEHICTQLRYADASDISVLEDGYAAAFQQPSRAIDCAMEIRDQLMEMGLGVRAAIHIGECDKSRGGLLGPTVELASRLLDFAKPGDVIASRTVRDLVMGSKRRFDRRGDIEYAGRPWQFFAIS